MKAKFFAALYVLIFLCIFICGCSQEQGNDRRIVSDFSAAFSAEYNGLELTGTITSSRQGMIYLTVNSPDTLAGLKSGIRNGTLTLQRDNLLSTADEAYLPKQSFPHILREALLSVSEGRITESADGTYTLSKPDGIVSTDENGFIRKIVLSDNSLTVAFSNCSESK